MPFRLILRYLLNNQHLIDRLAESYPVRRAAQLGAYLFLRGKQLHGESAEKLKDTDAVDRLNSFTKTFLEEVRKGFEKIKQTKND